MFLKTNIIVLSLSVLSIIQEDAGTNYNYYRFVFLMLFITCM